MNFHFIRCGLAGLLLALGARPARAQAPPPPPTTGLFSLDPTQAAYTGPRYPGGPDSLQATVHRLLRSTDPALRGELFLQLQLDSLGYSTQAFLLPPPAGSADIALYISPQVQGVVRQLVRRLPPWQLTREANGRRPAEAFVTIPLRFGPALANEPLVFSDIDPTFSVLPVQLGRYTRRVPRTVWDFINWQMQYPYEALVRGQQGTVYAYFEVDELGHVRQRRIVGTAKPMLDAEVLRVLRRLPNALSPPLYQGRAVCVSYVFPIQFSL